MNCYYLNQLKSKLMNCLKTSIVLSILLITTVHTTFSQPSNNYNQRLTQAKDSVEKVYIYHDIISDLKQFSLEEAIVYSKRALTLANKTNSADACGSTNEILGELYGRKNNIQPAINYYLISAKIYEELKNYRKLSRIYGNLGMLYYNNNYDTERTLYYYKISLDYAVKIVDQTLIAEAYNRIGGILYNQQNYTDALHYFENGLDIFKTLNDDANIAISLNNIGDVYRLMGYVDKALSYYQQSISLNEINNDIFLKAITYENIGQIHSEKGNIDLAFKYYGTSLDAYKSIDDVVGLTELYILTGDEYLNALEIEGAYNSYLSAYKLSIEHNKWQQIKQSALGLSKVFELKDDYEKSLEYLRTYARYNDTIIKKQMSDELYDLQSHFLRNISEKEIQIKDTHIELLQSEKKINTFRQNSLIFGVIILIILSIITFIRSRNRVKKEKLINLKDRQLHETQQELLRLELESKTSDLMTFALHLVQKNEVLNQLKTDLNSLSADQDNELNRKLKELSIHVQQSLQIHKEIEEFQHKVDVTYNDFFDKLKSRFPSLTKNEKRLCALLRLNLSTKEIASLNNISIKAVEMSRYRLRKKCHLNNQESLHEYMQNL